MRSSTKPHLVKSSGNVFEDLGIREPAEALAKSELAALVTRSIRQRKLTQTAAAKILGIDQPKVSELTRGRLARFSTERLMVFLTRLGQDVEIVVREQRPRGRERSGRIEVRATARLRGAGAPRPLDADEIHGS